MVWADVRMILLLIALLAAFGWAIRESIRDIYG